MATHSFGFGLLTLLSLFCEKIKINKNNRFAWYINNLNDDYNSDSDDDFVPEDNTLNSEDEYDTDDSSVNFADEEANESPIVMGCTR